MPVHLLNGLTRDEAQAVVKPITSIYTPTTKTIHPRPSPQTEELKPKVITEEDEDP